jgi:hypothetical protein
MAILVLGGEDDEHARHMLAYLRCQSADAELLDSKRFPGEIRIALDPGTRSGVIRLPSGRAVGLDEISAVYWRCYNGIPYPDLPDAEQAFVAYNDARGLFESLLIDLPARWVNGWRAYQLHQTKPVQLAIVAALGVPVPDTLLSNDPEAVREFAQRHERLIFKPVQGGAPTRPVAARHLTPENLRNLAGGPAALEEVVAGGDTRGLGVGRRVMVCRVLSPQLDYREDPDPRIETVLLPPSIESQCRQIARALGLLWTGIDLRHTPDDRYVFLEANPSPMFMGFEERCGLPLTEALGALLMGNDG